MLALESSAALSGSKKRFQRNEVRQSGKKLHYEQPFSCPNIIEEHLPESQCGFRANRGTIDMVFVLIQLQEKCREQNIGLYVTFVDLTKALDTVSRKSLWEIMKRLGCPQKFLSMVIQLHEDQRGQVSNDLSKLFPISNGVKQGCVLAPTLFTIFFSMVLKQTTEDLSDDNGIYIRYRFDGSLFNLRRLQSHTKTLKQLIRELLFADDAALVAHTEAALQRITSCFADYTALQSRNYNINISLTELKSVHQFSYLGCTISSDAKIDKEIGNRLVKANSAFGKLQKSVEQLTPEERYKDQCVQSCCTNHPVVRLRNLGYLPTSHTTA
ncbi:uncharacterized protein LOC125038649 [Penaeus chinensis]|uniref:uncharacterized protein LOC125038649 n=1 Tax=Penaeus chinensis TaxID=139456 RepID=UPI001FB79444|nr:uncharacterized protein LOC125038649 [Penaeus chinensis]